MLFKMIENDEKKGKTNIQWIDYLTERMLTYNNKNIHSATNMTPSEARKEKNEIKSKIQISAKARKDKIYPEVEIGDKVKIKRKKLITEKERTSNFLKGEYTVESITKRMGQKYYKMIGFNRPLIRSDFVKV